MNKTIREASTYLTGLLPPDSNFYTADDLLRLGMPDFVVRRIKVEVADRLSKSMVVPSTDWLDMERTVASTAWKQFKETVKGEAHLPRKHAAEIIDYVVIETVELIVAPRRRVIEWLFGHTQEASIGEVRQRSQYVTINRYLIDALVRYMERKDLPTITRVAAVDVIKTVDNRYVSGFTPLSWAQLIDPLFQLTRNRVDSDLIHDFFIDKGREDLAVLFPEEPSRIERVHLIERLSMGPLSKRPVDDLKLTRSQPAAQVLVAVEPAPIVHQHVQEVVQIPDPMPAEESLLEQVQVNQDVEADEASILAHQQLSLLEAETGEDHPPASIVPIWQRYLSDVPNQIDEEDSPSEYEPEEMVPFAQSFAPQEEVSATIASSLRSVGFQRAKLVDWLKTHENTYIQRVFDGNEMAYFRTIAELESSHDWSDAQSLLKGWVRSADVDLENAELGHLVDQLQIYFTKNDS
jgi:hypothetical protein